MASEPGLSLDLCQRPGLRPSHIPTAHLYDEDCCFRDLLAMEQMFILGGMLLRYLANLSTGRLILWCYFLWYVVVLVRYFDPNLRLWLTSVGLSLIIGFALYISTTAAGNRKVQLEFWQ